MPLEKKHLSQLINVPTLINRGKPARACSLLFTNYPLELLLGIRSYTAYMAIIFILLLLITDTSSGIQSQSTTGVKVFFHNPSFEDEPADATMPHGWWGCEPLTTPDILPGYWGVYQPPSEGESYVGLITRENGTFESIGQRLSGVLKKDFCYSFLMDLAHSATYSGYNEAIQIRIWISNKKCGQQQLIFQSPLINHKQWQTYEVDFTPDIDSEYIRIEAFTGAKNIHKKGNILIDNLSAIVNCSRV
ncbi:MAG TPA: hypothetical protein PKC30_08885 [Saprospiraceae bacterium]|nr:hypothetical protein [Saprospiraceae bacterium]